MTKPCPVKGGSASPKTMPEAIAGGANIRWQSRIVANALRTTRSTLKSQKFSRIQYSIRIESLFQAAVHVTDNLARRLRPPSFFGDTDSVFAGNYATPC